MPPKPKPKVKATVADSPLRCHSSRYKATKLAEVMKELLLNSQQRNTPPTNAEATMETSEDTIRVSSNTTEPEDSLWDNIESLPATSTSKISGDRGDDTSLQADSCPAMNTVDSKLEGIAVKLKKPNPKEKTGAHTAMKKVRFATATKTTKATWSAKAGNMVKATTAKKDKPAKASKKAKPSAKDTGYSSESSDEHEGGQSDVEEDEDEDEGPLRVS